MSASLETIQNNTKILKEDLTQRLNNSTKINELFKKEPIKQSRKHYNSRMTGFESLQNEYKSFDSELDASIKQLNECKDLVANINKNGEQLIAILNDKKVATLKIQVQDEINNNPNTYGDAIKLSDLSLKDVLKSEYGGNRKTKRKKRKISKPMKISNGTL